MKETFKQAVKALDYRLKGARLHLTDRIDLTTSQSVNTQECQAVCLALGPYRNLTTLTAATLFLHPNCQVLNHAGRRIYGNKQVDFLSDYSPERLNRFIQFAIQISGKGQRGDLGGSIAYSHAFDSQNEMKAAHAKTGAGLLKKHIKSLFWKESLRTSNLIREKQVDLATILDSDSRLRFLLPIRNPLDCARSNLTSGHMDLFRGINKNSPITDVVQAILDEIHWFASYQRDFPDRFFYYFEHGISRRMLVNLAVFMKLDADESWLSDALSVMISKSHYEHDSRLLDFYRQAVHDTFPHFPALSRGLLAFA